MLEILSHQYLKKYSKSNKINWEHAYSFIRIASKCIRSQRNCLINSEMFATYEWLLFLLIPLFLNKRDAICVVNKRQLNFLQEEQLTLLKELGFKFKFDKRKICLDSHQIFFLDLKDLIKKNTCKPFELTPIIFSEISNIKEDLKNIFLISLDRRNWFQINHYDNSQEIIGVYNFLKRSFFARSVEKNKVLTLEESDIKFLEEFFIKNKSFSKEFLAIKYAFESRWACWVELDHINLEWTLKMEPVDECLEIKSLLKNNFCLFLSKQRKDNFFQSYLSNYQINIYFSLSLKSNFVEKDIIIYCPSRQILPNNPKFSGMLLKQTKKLIMFRKGWILILSNDNNLKIKIATELAALYGHKVLNEKLPTKNDEIVCATYQWWLNQTQKSVSPDQIIVLLLPIPSVEMPINSLTIKSLKKNSKDWFRDFLLPEAIRVLDISVSPLRKNAGKLIILDGRVTKRKWGRDIIQFIQPSKIVHHILPFE